MTQTSTNESDAKPSQRLFLHKAQLDSVTGLMKEGAVLITGGRGVGKTRLAREIENKLIKETVGMPPPCYVRGERGEDWDTAASGHVIVDDVDVLIREGIGSNESEEDNARNFQILTHKLRQQLRRCGPERQLLLTSTVNFQGPRVYDLTERLTASIRDWATTEVSDTLQLAKIVYIDPWREGWAVDFGTAFHDEYKEVIKNEDLRNRWIKSLIDLTGCYPALVEPILRELDEYESSEAIEEVSGRGFPYEEFITAKASLEGMRGIRSMVYNLQKSDYPAERSAHSLLRDFAFGRVPELKAHVEELAILQACNLLRRKRMLDGRITCEIPGVLIQNLIRGTAGTTAPSGEGRFTPKADSKDGGVFTVGNIEVELPGRLWETLILLRDNPGYIPAPVKPQEGDSLTLDRNSIQRLRISLEQAGLGHYIDNKHGEGYRYVSNPAPPPR